MEREKVLVVGGGGREHALCEGLLREGAAEVLCAPGNAGTALAGCRNVDVAATDVDALTALARDERVDLVVVGPEAPLVAGLADRLRGEGVAVFGPSAAAAMLEGSKAFAKEVMDAAGVPTAPYRVFDDPEEAAAYVRTAARPLVVKADGLAAGKGVVVASDPEEALQAIDRAMRQRVFGEAGARVVIEEVLQGEEVSYHVLADGEAYVPLAPAQDHKRAYEGDRGPNTGGMGAYSPPPLVDEALERRIRERIVEPTLAELVRRGRPLRGALFVGLMVQRGEPHVLEFNVRFGDPECEALVARWDGSLLPVLSAAAHGRLEQAEPRWAAPASLTVVIASEGYPGPVHKGRLVEGLEAAQQVPGVTVFHAGTRLDEEGRVRTSGGRVFAVTATGDELPEAARRAYEAADLIRFDGAWMRRDIGARALGTSGP